MSAAADRHDVIAALRRAGARFAFVFGSRAAGHPDADSDLDVAAWWAIDAPAAWEVDVPPGVDLLVLNGAALELAGRVALDGQLLFDDEPAQRVEWQSTTRKLHLDEQYRQRRFDRDFVEGQRSRRSRDG